jgi:hypothetical protein
VGKCKAHKVQHRLSIVFIFIFIVYNIFTFMAKYGAATNLPYFFPSRKKKMKGAGRKSFPYQARHRKPK